MRPSGLSRGGLLALILAFVVAIPAGGYRLRSFEIRVPDSATAVRWSEDDFPLRFRMLENDNLPPGLDLTQERWTEIVRRGLRHWTGITTARIELVLEDTTVAIRQAEDEDGRNTIGFSSHEAFEDSWITAWARWIREGDELRGCDIEVNPDFVKNWAPHDATRLLEIVATHEMGHCLGLAHTEPFPMPLWTELPVHADPSFLPDPVMSYSNSYGLDLPDDDTQAVSLLYPAPGFLESHGAVRGRVILGDRPAAFAYVQAVRPGEPGFPGRPGPGTFSDEDGDFHLEGVSPGTWMLWTHPILVTRRNAHGSMLTRADEAEASGFRDQLRWVRVEAGEVLEEVTIVVRPGREATP